MLDEERVTNRDSALMNELALKEIEWRKQNLKESSSNKSIKDNDEKRYQSFKRVVEEANDSCYSERIKSQFLQHGEEQTRRTFT